MVLMLNTKKSISCTSSNILDIIPITIHSRNLASIRTENSCLNILSRFTKILLLTTTTAAAAAAATAATATTTTFSKSTN